MSVGQPWWQVTLGLPESQADDAAALLMLDGALGVELQPEDLPPPRFAQHGEPLAYSVPTGEGLTTLLISYPGDLTDRDVRTAVRDSLAQIGAEIDPGNLELHRRTDQGWAERWKEFFQPLRMSGRLWVVPSWHRDEPLPPGSVRVVLDPGMAFGTGQHPTTALCAELIDAALLAGRVETMLDVGTGSGVLAIAACHLGCPKVTAIDNDPRAVEACSENAARNNVSLEVSDTPLCQLTQTFDLVVANILAVVLVDLAPQLLKSLKPKGQLILSGILEEQKDEVVSAFTAQGQRQKPCALRLRQTVTAESWVALRFA